VKRSRQNALRINRKKREDHIDRKGMIILHAMRIGPQQQLANRAQRNGRILAR
jgi:hypothetical protein